MGLVTDNKIDFLNLVILSITNKNIGYVELKIKRWNGEFTVGNCVCFNLKESDDKIFLTYNYGEE